MSISITTAQVFLQKLCKKSFFVFLLLATSYLLPTVSFAATLSLDPKEGEFGPGDMFVVTVRIDTATNECINAATVDVLFPSNIVKVVAVSKGESLLSLWTDEPSINKDSGEVSWSGGIPGGYCGRVLGDPGKTNILGKIVFNVISGDASSGAGSSVIPITFASGTSVLLNDGFGTAAPLTMHTASLTRIPHSTGVKNEWLDIVHADTLPPDAFGVSVHHEQSTFGGKYFIVFSSVDKQSGIDHFEVMEDDPVRLGFVRGGNTHARFTTAASPYLLSDQSLKSRVVVRAYDNAGNIQESILPPTNGAFSLNTANDTGALSEEYKDIWWVILIALFLITFSYAYWHHRRKSSSGVSATIPTHEDTSTTEN